MPELPPNPKLLKKRFNFWESMQQDSTLYKVSAPPEHTHHITYFTVPFSFVQKLKHSKSTAQEGPVPVKSFYEAVDPGMPFTVLKGAQILKLLLQLVFLPRSPNKLRKKFH